MTVKVTLSEMLQPLSYNGLRWHTEGYDKWDALTIERHRLRWQSEGYDKWDTPTIERHRDSDGRVKL